MTMSERWGGFSDECPRAPRPPETSWVAVVLIAAAFVGLIIMAAW